MTIQTIKRMLDACYQAKRIREMLPALPSGVTPSYIHFLDVIQIMDGRITYISLTEEGRKLSEKYSENYFSGLAPYLESISEADAEAMIHAIETFYQVMCERREYFEK